MSKYLERREAQEHRRDGHAADPEEGRPERDGIIRIIQSRKAARSQAAQAAKARK